MPTHKKISPKKENKLHILDHCVAQGKNNNFYTNVEYVLPTPKVEFVPWHSGTKHATMCIVKLLIPPWKTLFSSCYDGIHKVQAPNTGRIQDSNVRLFVLGGPFNM